jgi:hypothetical protein
MSGQEKHDKIYLGIWYQNVDPRELVYTLGYGFNHRSPAIVEKRLIAHYSYAVMFCLTGFYFLGAVLPPFFSRLLAPVFALASAAQANAASLILACRGPFVFFPFGMYAFHRHSAQKNSAAHFACDAPPRGLFWPRCRCPAWRVHDQAAAGVFSVGCDLPRPPPCLTPFLPRALYLNLTVPPAVFEDWRFGIPCSPCAVSASVSLICRRLSSPLSTVLVLMPMRFDGTVIGYFVLFSARCAWASPFTLRIISSFFC